MKKHLNRFFSTAIAVFVLYSSILPPGYITAAAQNDNYVYLPILSHMVNSWPMAGANPERTSWTKEEVRGQLYPQWYRPIEPYIAPKVQVIGAFNYLYLSTARGLYVLNARDGSDRWVFPTELPLGHSPTVHGYEVYVGGMDKNLYALNALSGTLLWKFTAGAGFDTNPLVVDGKVYAGNRDGTFYAIHTAGANRGRLAWSFKTGGPIHYSAAYKDGVVYFASEDSHAYALNAATGALVWKSAKLPGAGFHSWWPVIYNNYIIFAGSPSYRTNTSPGKVEGLAQMDRDYIFPNYLNLPNGTKLGPQLADGSLDVSKTMDYFEQYPHRRTYFLLNRANGSEVSFDTDGDGRKEYAPFLWYGTYAGNRYPPVVGTDSILYQSNMFASAGYISRGQVTGWKIGADTVTLPTGSTLAVDEPVAYAAGGNMIYYNLCCDRAAGGFDYRLLQTSSPDQKREWVYFSYDLEKKIPGYDQMYYAKDIETAFGGKNGVYGTHGDQNPPIPYRGMVYMHRGNAMIGFGIHQNQPNQLPMAKTQAVPKTSQPVDRVALAQRLQAEVQQIISSGHLRPAFGMTGVFDRAGQVECGDNLVDYFSNPADNIYTLLIALPHLNEPLKTQARAYIQKEFNDYLPYRYHHIGWETGAPREPFILAPEVEAGRAGYKKTEYTQFLPWMSPGKQDGFPPHVFYTLWKYAQEFGGAADLYQASKGKLSVPPPDNTVMARYPAVHNAYIAGYTGYLNLEKLAGQPESSTVRSELNRLLTLRSTSFAKDSTLPNQNYCRAMNVSQNFMYMTPELGNHLRANSLPKVQTALAEYNTIAPYWFVTKFEATIGEGLFQPLYDYQANFQARALILKEPASELVKYLDVPAFPVGDLFYIQNLVYLLTAP